MEEKKNLLNDKISIIMPSYNSQMHIKEAIESVISQTYPNWELLIINDGSTDNTKEIIDAYSKKDNRIKVFHIENSGVSQARNVGIDNATGKWITFFDSDDMLTNDALMTLVNNSTNCDLVIGRFNYYPINSRHFINFEEKYYESFKDLEPMFVTYHLNIMFSTIWGKLFKKEAINIRFDKRYQNGEDTLFFSMLIKNLKGIKILSNVIYDYRRGNNIYLSYQFNPTLMDAIELTVKNYQTYFNNQEITSFLQSYYVTHLTNEIDKLYNLHNINDKEKEVLLSSFLKKDYLKHIEPQKFHFTTSMQRKANLLLIGDIKLIVNEFNKNKLVIG